MKTRCIDRNGKAIYEGDILHVEEYPDKLVGGSLDFEGVVSMDKGSAYVTYYDIGEEESFLISHFPKAGRMVLSEKDRRDYWKTALLGGEPPEYLWKEDLYREHFNSRKGKR